MSCKEYYLGQPVNTVNGTAPDGDGNVEIKNDYGTKQAIVDLVYPVGSYYTSSIDTSPATLFGGTWEQIKDRFLWAKGDSDTVGSTGGEKNHTLSVAEMPTHSHSASSGGAGAHTPSGSIGSTNITGWFDTGAEYYVGTQKVSGVFTASSVNGVRRNADAGDDKERRITMNSTHSHTLTMKAVGDHSHTVTVGNNGSGTAHNNMPPYLVVYMWKRTA